MFFDVTVIADGERITLEEIEASTEGRARKEVEDLIQDSGAEAIIVDVRLHKYPSIPMTMADLDFVL